jgi:hypothetical protein
MLNRQWNCLEGDIFSTPGSNIERGSRPAHLIEFNKCGRITSTYLKAGSAGSTENDKKSA